MLKNLRKKKTARKVWITLALVIIPAFVLWGSGSLIRSQQETSYKVRLFGKNISQTEYNDSLSAVKTTAIMQFGDNLSQIEKYLNFESQAIERLILLQEAKKRRLTASDKEIRDTILNYQSFQRNGQFDNKIYTEILRYVFRLQPRAFEEQTRQNLILSKLYDQITGNISLNEQTIREGYQKANEELRLSYLAAIPQDFTKEITLTDLEIKDYFVKNSLQFKQPLSFNLEYISIETELKLKEIYPRVIKKKANVEEILKDSGVTLKESGFFTQTEPIPGIGWSAEIMNLLPSLKKGEFSEPIHTDKYYIIRIKERKEPYIPEFEKIKDKVKEAFIKDKSSQIAKAKIEESLKKLKETYQLDPKQIDFEKSAKENGLKFGTTNLFKYGSYIDGIGASDDLWIAAEALQDEQISGIITMPSGFYIVKLKEKKTFDEKKFETEKAEFSKKLLNQKKQEEFTKFSEELKRKAH